MAHDLAVLLALAALAAGYSLHARRRAAPRSRRRRPQGSSARGRRPGAWRVLGVPPASTREEARARYMELARKEHPDHGGDARRMARINRAWDEVRAQRGW